MGGTGRAKIATGEFQSAINRVFNSWRDEQGQISGYKYRFQSAINRVFNSWGSNPVQLMTTQGVSIRYQSRLQFMAGGTMFHELEHTCFNPLSIASSIHGGN